MCHRHSPWNGPVTASPLEPGVLPAGVVSRFVEGVNGLRMHLLEAGEPASPCVVLLHGFPELAYSWRKILPRLAEAGFHAVAPDCEAMAGPRRASQGSTRT